MLRKIFRGCLVFIVLLLVVLGGLVAVAIFGATSDWDWSWEDPLTQASWDGDYSGSYSLSAEPSTALTSDPIAISASGFSPGQQVGIRAKTTDSDGNSWESAALFEADGSGNIDVSSQAPVAGSYAGVDPMGLFWSMRPSNPLENNFFWGNSDGYDVVISLEANGTTLQEQVVTRLKQSPDLVREDVLEDGVTGVFYYPEQAEPLPTILILGGSEGGIPESAAGLWASHGYAALAIGYFNAEGKPDILSEIPLETFDDALAWLKANPAVDPDRIAISGTSRGSEAALLTAAANPEIAAVIAVVPSSMVWSGLDFAGRGQNEGRVPSAWTRNGEQLPSNDNSFSMETLRSLLGQPSKLVGTFESGLNAPVQGSLIPVEEIEAPILLISGTDDMLWPSYEFALQIVDRLDKQGFAYPVEHVALEGTGHSVRTTYEPPVFLAGTIVLGGDYEASGKATQQNWQSRVDFLNEHLGQ